MRIKSVAKGCLLSLILMGLVGSSPACSSPNGSDPMEGQEMSSKTIQEALETHSPELLSVPGVVGTAQSLCEGKPCIQVLVNQKTPSLEQKILSILEGYPVRIEETGPIRALPSS